MKQSLSTSVQFDLQYEIFGDDMVFYHLDVLQDDWNIFGQNSIKGISNLESLQLFLKRPTLENYQQLTLLGELITLDKFYLVKDKDLQLMQDKQLHWNYFYHELLISFSNLLPHDILTLQEQTIVWIPNKEDKALFKIYSKNDFDCLYFPSQVFFPSLQNDSWKEKGSLSLLTGSFSQCSAQEQFQYFIEELFAKHTSYFSFLECAQEQKKSAFYHDPHLISLSLRVQEPSLYQVAWEQALVILNNNHQSYYNQIEHQIKHIDLIFNLASLFLFKIYKLDKILDINFLNLAKENFSEENVIEQLEKSTHYFILNNEIEYKNNNSKAKVKI